MNERDEGECGGLADKHGKASGWELMSVPGNAGTFNMFWLRREKK